MNNINGNNNNSTFNKPQVMSPKVIASVNIQSNPSQPGVSSNYSESVAATKESGSGDSYKKPILIAVSAVAAFALIFVLLKVFVFKGDSDDNEVEDDVTVTTTEAPTTEEIETTTEETTEEITTTEEVTTEEAVLEGSWTDYCFMMGDEFYQLPMTYEEWIAYGWQCDDVNIAITPGEVITYKFYKDDIICNAYLVNYGAENAYREECQVIGIEFDEAAEDLKADLLLRFPGDIIVDMQGTAESSTMDDVIECYGNPNEGLVGNIVSYCIYYAVDNSLIYFEGFGDYSPISYVRYISLTPMEGATITAMDEAPEVLPACADYVTPGYTADRFDDIYNIDGVNYRLPVPLSKFLENGWTYELSNPDNSIIRAYEAVSVTLRKGDCSIDATIGNPMVYQITPEQSEVYGFTIVADECPGMDFTFPGGLKFGDSDTLVEELYSDIAEEYPESYDEVDLFHDMNYEIRYPACDGEIYYYIFTMDLDEEDDDSSRVIYQYTCEREIDPSSGDPANTDYIKYKTVR